MATRYERLDNLHNFLSSKDVGDEFSLRQAASQLGYKVDTLKTHFSKKLKEYISRKADTCTIITPMELGTDAFRTLMSQSTATTSQPEKDLLRSDARQWRVLHQVSEGGYGEVHEVELIQGNPPQRASSAQRYAAKWLRPIALSNEKARERFRREGQLMCEHSHPNLMFVFEIIDHLSLGQVLIMPLASNSLDQMIEAQPYPVMLRYFEDIVGGLEYLHGSSIVHRDLKMSNVLIMPNGRARIADFGTLLEMERTHTAITASNSFVGTERYAAPEQHLDPKNVDEKADVYALSIMAFEIVTGKVGHPYVIQQILPTLSEPIRDVLEVARSLEPEARNCSPRDILDALQAQGEH